MTNHDEDVSGKPQELATTLLARVFDYEPAKQQGALERACRDHPELAIQLRAAYANVDHVEAVVTQIAPPTATDPSPIDATITLTFMTSPSVNCGEPPRVPAQRP